MKKRWMALLLAGCLAVLAGCTKTPVQDGASTGYTKEQVTQILDSGAFTDELEELDCDTAWALYQLDSSGLEREQMLDGVIYRSAGATCEEVALLIFEDDATAATVKNSIGTYVQGQIEENRDYRPGEIPKLEDALLQQQGSTVLLAVSADAQAVRNVLERK